MTFKHEQYDVVQLKSDGKKGYCERGMIVAITKVNGDGTYLARSISPGCTCHNTITDNDILETTKQGTDIMATVSTVDVLVSKLSANQIKLYKAGFIDEYGTLLDPGKKALWSVLLDANTDELIKVIDAVETVKAQLV